MQQQSQSFDAYLTELRVQAKKCAYGTLQDELIRDRAVVGIRDDQVRSRLLREPELTLQKCIDISHAAEISQKQIQEIKDETNTVHEMKPTHRPQADKGHPKHKLLASPQERRKFRSTRIPECKYCGTQHTFRKELCPAFGKMCSSCGRGNHFSRVCQSSRRVHAANITSNLESSDDEFFVGTIKTQQTATVNDLGIDEWTAELEINGQAIKVKLDSGAKCNVIPKSVLNQIRSNDKLQKSNTKIVSYGGHKMDVLGHTMLLCEYKGKMYVLRFYVIEGDETPILGLQACQELNLIRVDQMKPITIESITQEYSDVFNETLGCLPVQHTINLKDDDKPVIHAPRKIPVAICDRVKEELDRMQHPVLLTPSKNQRIGYRPWLLSQSQTKQEFV